ncbi:GW dipeptide domain-containing protein [Gaetbulibacter sp. M235]|uniref:GW dipeptide domain-containing protein n=1 Tax=Gaetbulibacter sp. M235 TaxID=3126510 RepID=UPI00374F2CD0
MKHINLISVLVIFLFFGCKDKYKTVPTVVNNGSHVNPQVSNPEAEKLHTVVVKEVIQTPTYTYLNVNEGDKNFWIAVNSGEAKVGETYFYVGGLLKENFESKELNKTFDELYLIGNLVSANHGNQMSSNDSKNEDLGAVKEPVTNSVKTNIIRQSGSVKISEIVNNPKKYEGQTVQIDGECTKINNGIMGKNWIHLKDGSKDDFDLVITSNDEVTVGSVVTIKGDVILNKDFGAGYKYDLILENGVIVKK